MSILLLFLKLCAFINVLIGLMCMAINATTPSPSISPTIGPIQSTISLHICVRHLSNPINGQYVYDGMANGAPSWKKIGDINYYIYLHADYFHINSDATKTDANSTRSATCYANGTLSPVQDVNDKELTAGNCLDNIWRLQYIDTNDIWQDVNVTASVKPRICPTDIPTNIPTNNPIIKSATDNPTFLPTSSPSNIPSLSPTTIPTLSPSNFPTISPTQIPRKYIKVNLELSWFEAERYCMDVYGTNLATIVTEQDFAEAVIQNDGDDRWIGLNDINESGQWKWTNLDISCDYTPDNLCSSDTHWISGEPSHLFERCAAMTGSFTSLSSDDHHGYVSYKCTYELEFLCDCIKQLDGSYICPEPRPTNQPTSAPTFVPTYIPTNIPTKTPTNIPTKVPTEIPTNIPTNNPTIKPTINPTKFFSFDLTFKPTINPTLTPSQNTMKTLFVTTSFNEDALSSTEVSNSNILLIMAISMFIAWCFLFCGTALCIWKKQKKAFAENTMVNMTKMQRVKSQPTPTSPTIPRGTPLSMDGVDKHENKNSLFDVNALSLKEHNDANMHEASLDKIILSDIEESPPQIGNKRNPKDEGDVFRSIDTFSKLNIYNPSQRDFNFKPIRKAINKFDK